MVLICIIGLLMNKLSNLLGALRFYRNNHHRIPIIRNLLCKMGRHDYEVFDVNPSDYHIDKDGYLVSLKCFYCDSVKSTYNF